MPLKAKAISYFVRNDFDWFVKADDDTYMIIENLRRMIKPYNTSMPIFFGSKLMKPIKK